MTLNINANLTPTTILAKTAVNMIHTHIHVHTQGQFLCEQTRVTIENPQGLEENM